MRSDLAKTSRALADHVHGQALEALAFVDAFEVHTPEDADKLAAAGKIVHTRKRQHEDELKRMNAPHRAGIKDNNEAWKPVIETLDRVAKLAKSVIKAWREAAQERAIAALPAATTHAEKAAAVEVLVARPLKRVKYYTVRIVDESLVPRKYWTIDKSALNRVASAAKETFDEPGCELVIDERETYG